MDRPIRWKNGARCAVMISFDVDGESPWILRDPRGPSRSRSTTWASA